MNNFKTAIIDPPWAYGKGTESFQGTAAQEYKTMSNAEILALRIEELRLDYVFLWVGSNFLPIGLDLLQKWGTPYCSQLVWYKGGTGSIGTWFRSGHELCLFGHRKGVATIRSTQATAFEDPEHPNAFEHSRLKHSKKPRVLHEFIETTGEKDGNSPGNARKHVRIEKDSARGAKGEEKFVKIYRAYPGPYLEIFGRESRKGWYVIGNEAPATMGEDITVSLQNIIDGKAKQ